MVGFVREIWRFPVKSMRGERLERALVASSGIAGDRGWAVRGNTTGEIHNAKRFPILLRCAARYRVEPASGTIPAVDIELPDGTIVGSDSPECNARLSGLMNRAVSLVAVRPPADRAFYRRTVPAATLIGPLTRFRFVRKLLQRAAASELRAELGRERGEPLPDLSTLPPEVFEFYTPPGTFFDAFPVHLLTTASLDWMQRLTPASSWDVRRFRPNFLVQSADGQPGPAEPAWCGHTINVGPAALRGQLLAPRCAMPAHAQGDLARDPGVLRTIVRHANEGFGLYASVDREGIVACGDQVFVA